MHSAQGVDLQTLSPERVKQLACDVTWDLYNKLVDEVPALNSDAGWDAFDELIGFEIESALDSLRKREVEAHSPGAPGA